MIEKLLVVSILVLGWSGLAAAETYRWEDADGRVHYSDTPPPSGARNIKRSSKGGEGNEAAAPTLPYELREAVRTAPVKLYVTDCGDPCDMARALLIKRGVPHTLLDANRVEVQQALKALPAGRLEVPVAEVGTIVLWGFEKKRWHAALDKAGYPREALISVTPTVPREQPPDLVGAESDNDDADGVSADDAASDIADGDGGDQDSDDGDDISGEDEETDSEDEDEQ